MAENIERILIVVRAVSRDDTLENPNFSAFDGFVTQFIDSFLVDTRNLDDWTMFSKELLTSLNSLRSAITRFRAPRPS